MKVAKEEEDARIKAEKESKEKEGARLKAEAKDARIKPEIEAKEKEIARSEEVSRLKNENQASTRTTYSISCFVHMADTEYTVG